MVLVLRYGGFEDRRGLKRSIIVTSRKIILSVHPLAAGEVREIHSFVAHQDGAFAQGCDGAPGGGVVYIHRSSRIAFDGLYESMQYKEVHAAMTGAFGVLAPAAPEGVI